MRLALPFAAVLGLATAAHGALAPGAKAPDFATRGAVAGKVPSDLLALYDKQRERYGVGASHLRAGITSASGVALKANDLDAIRAAAPDDVLLCPDSSAILVRTSESGI